MAREIIAPFKPLDWQFAPFRDKSLVMLLTGSAGGGKSRLAGEKLHGFCQKYTGSQALMVRKTRNSMTNSTVLFMDRAVIGNDPRVVHKQQKNRFEYANGSILTYGGMANDEQREQIRSVGQEGGVDIAWMEEANAFTEEDFNELMARMRGNAAGWRQLILTTNPDAPMHWINQRLILNGGAQVYYSSAADNTYNPAEYEKDILGRLTGVLRERLVEGRWVAAEGAVYAQYRDELHLIDPFEIPADWRRFRAIDFGYTNPFNCQWWAMDPDGRLYLYREIYMSRRLVEDHARQIVELSKGENIEATVADHDAEDRATLERYGVVTLPAKKDVSVGIQAVQARLRKAGDGKPRLYLMRDAVVETDRRLEAVHKPTSTAGEITGYVWQESRADKAEKEAPAKVDDHGMDSMRYMVMHIEGAWGSVEDMLGIW